MIHKREQEAEPQLSPASICVLLILLFFTLPINVSLSDDLKQKFIDPPLHYAPRPLWFWNNTTVTAEGIVEQMRLSRDRCGYGGFGILPFGKDFKPEYLTGAYFDLYRIALEQARDLQMTMCIYDEYGFSQRQRRCDTWRWRKLVLPIFILSSP